jgi:hypothetical protein
MAVAADDEPLRRVVVNANGASIKSAATSAVINSSNCRIIRSFLRTGLRLALRFVVDDDRRTWTDSMSSDDDDDVDDCDGDGIVDGDNGRECLTRVVVIDVEVNAIDDDDDDESPNGRMENESESTTSGI